MARKTRRFITVDHEATLDLTVSLREFLPPDHLARFVVDVIAQLELHLRSLNGYFSEGNVTACETRGIDPYIATGREPHHQSWKAYFAELPAPPPEDASPTVKMAYKLQTDSDGTQAWGVAMHFNTSRSTRRR